MPRREVAPATYTLSNLRPNRQLWFQGLMNALLPKKAGASVAGFTSPSGWAVTARLVCGRRFSTWKYLLQKFGDTCKDRTAAGCRNNVDTGRPPQAECCAVTDHSQRHESALDPASAVGPALDPCFPQHDTVDMSQTQWWMDSGGDGGAAATNQCRNYPGRKHRQKEDWVA